MQNRFTIDLPKLFDFDQCLRYLDRNENECLHHVEQGEVWKLLYVKNEFILIKLSQAKEDKIQVATVVELDEDKINFVRRYIEHWFDLIQDMTEVNASLAQDEYLSSIISNNIGTRLIGLNDVFEALSWAIIGQQINLSFAYQVKRNLVHACGVKHEFQGRKFFHFPTPQAVLNLSESHLQEMKFSRQKIRYIKVVADKFVNGHWSNPYFFEQQTASLQKELISTLGIGAWSANYVLMRCIRDADAFPAGDAGLKKAWLLLSGDKVKTKDLEDISRKWSPYRAYAAFYLWMSLY